MSASAILWQAQRSRDDQTKQDLILSLAQTIHDERHGDQRVVCYPCQREAQSELDQLERDDEQRTAPIKRARAPRRSQPKIHKARWHYRCSLCDHAFSRATICQRKTVMPWNCPKKACKGYGVLI